MGKITATPKSIKPVPRSRDLIDRAVAVINDFYAVGARSINKHSGRMPHGSMREEARRAGMNPEMLAKARLFAAPERGGYTPQELRELLDLIRQHRTVIGTGHIIRLLAVRDKRSRGALQREMLAHGWSRRDLDLQIRFRFGKRRQSVGRKPMRLGTPQQACVLLVQLCQRWEGVCCSLRASGDGDTKSVHDALPPRLKAAIDIVEADIERLHKLLESGVPEDMDKDARRAQDDFFARLRVPRRRRITFPD